jgi:16S rRNA (cytosine1402-N4)-methyltransferase
MTGRTVSRDRDHPNVRPHIPVLLSQVLSALQPKDGETYLDGTFGAGGYSTAILDAANCQVLALDRDPSVIEAAHQITPRYPNRLTVVLSPFSAMQEVWRIYQGQDVNGAYIVPQADGIVLDIGISSMQIDQPERGFSFMTDGPLDMRMSADGDSAADILNTASETEIADILYQYGEERRSRHIAKAIVAQRADQPFTRTLELAALVEKVIGRKPGDHKHPATRTFQALRIAVNNELGELGAALAAAEQMLKPGGRLVVVTFHSLEDRIVKDFMRERSDRAARGSRFLPEETKSAPRFRLVNQRALSPTEEEISVNPRARSARLRAAVRTEAK